MPSSKKLKDFLRYHVLSRIQKRRFQAYCVGAPKSGTHSIAALFSARYRTYHEPEAKELTDLFVRSSAHAVPEEELRRHFKERDRRLWLEMESSHFIFYFVHILTQEFPGAKFILTIRDCASWLDSVLNQQLRGPWGRLEEVRFRPERFRHSEEEQPLLERGLYPLDAYLSYWAEHNQKVLSTVPKNRLLVIRTDEIQARIKTIADFAGVPVQSLDADKSHTYKAPEKFDLLPQIKKDFLNQKIDIHCRRLRDQFFS